MRSQIWLGFLLTVALVVMLMLAPSLSGSSVQTVVTPVYYDDNPPCTSFGYSAGVKQDPTDPNASYTLTVPGVGHVYLQIDGNDEYFSWTSDFGIDAVIAKGGSNGNIFKYDPPAESFGD